jgi:hypothetical protein
MSPLIKHALLKDVIIFEINDKFDDSLRQGYNGFFPGVLRPQLEWEHEKVI